MVCVPELQRGMLSMLLALLIHQAEGSITERQETVIVGIQSAAVAGERRNERAS